MNNSNKATLILLMIISAVFLSGCMDSPSANESNQSHISGNPTLMSTRNITDLAGRVVTVPMPEDIQRVSCLHPIATYMAWRLTPEKLISIDMVFNSSQRLVPDYAEKQFRSLPVTGVFFKGMNREMMVGLEPDVIVSMTKDPELDKEQIDYGAPVFAISKDELEHYEQSFRLMGILLGNEKEANELADYWNNTIGKVTKETSKIKEEDRLKVYYTSHNGPLSTVGPRTVMSSIIGLAGGINYYDTNNSLPPADQVNEAIIINVEQVIKWNPDVIITKTGSAKTSIMNDPQWKTINAVKDQRVYTVPRWESLDGMQSLMGLVWTAKTLYPDEVSFDLNKETRLFYSKFYLYDNMTDEQIAAIAA